MTSNRPQFDREAALEQIREHSTALHEVARRYDNLRWMAEQDTTNAFLDLAETAGKMTLDSLAQLGTLLEILRCAFAKNQGGG